MSLAVRGRLWRTVVASVTVLVGAGFSSTIGAQPSSMGLTGLIHMPSARMEADGSFIAGYAHAKPYSAPYVSVQALPFLQLAGRYTRIHGIDTGVTPGWENYGDYKDKAASFKLRLLPENAWGYRWIPEVAIGGDDLHGTKLFASQFVAANKQVNVAGVNADFTLGYGRQRIGGLYGGARLSLDSLPSWVVVVEYDRTNYHYTDHYSRTGLAPRSKGAWGGALEYRYGSLSLQAGRMHGQNVYNVSLNLPLQKREFIPKLEEAGPFANGAWASSAARPTALQWNEDEQWRLRMLQAFYTEGLTNVKVAWRDGVLALSFSSARYRYATRGIGRAALLALAHAPVETERMELTWETHGMGGMTWSFYDVTVLQRYFAGTASRAQLAHAMSLHYADPKGRSEAARANDINETLYELAQQRTGRFAFNRNLVAFSANAPGLATFSVNPYITTYLNDPSGAFKYDVGLNLNTNITPARGWLIKGGVMGSLSENISDVTQKSNSLLPHVRSDLAEFRKAARVKVNHLTLSRYWHPATRTYVRASAGLYEEMYGGVGVQALHLDRRGRFAWDVAVDAVQKRNYKGTGFADYKTVTAIGSMHYRVPGLEGVTATVRAGRFLARDVGVRFELSRTFRSGIELGVWYTRTNGNDITSPGRPGDPYYDKGVFMRIPLSTLTVRDTSSRISFGLAPWNRDVGQMVGSPGDLYGLMRDSWLDNALEGDSLRSFSDVYGEDRP